MPATGTPAGERLTDIIGAMVHGGVNARRTLARGLIVTYITPEPDTPREQQRYSLTAARIGLWPDEPELKIVRDCLYRAWRRHPVALVYDESQWIKAQRRLSDGRLLGAFTTTWRQWPVREVFSAPAELRETLAAALAKR